MDQVTMAVAQYVRDKGIAVTSLAEKTGIPYGVVYPSLCANPTRKLRAYEFMQICGFLGVHPEDFWAPQPINRPE